MQRLPLLVRALRWRAAATASVLAVASLAVLAAAAGPLYLGAADDTVLHATLGAAGSESDAITAADIVPSTAAPSLAQAALRLERRQSVQQWYGPGVVTADASLLGYGDLVARTGVCLHLSFVAGHCATKPRQVEVTTRTAESDGFRIGTRFTPTVKIGGRAVPLTGPPFVVVGLIRPGNPAAAYWLGDDFFTQDQGGGDALFTPLSSMTGLPSVSTAQFPLRISSTSPSNLQQIADAVRGYEYAATTTLGLDLTTGFFATLGQYDRQATEMAEIVAVVDLELVLLAVLTLYGLVVRTSEARQREMALAKSRGFRFVSVLSFGISEPLAVLCLSFPIGLGLAWAAMNVVSPLVLDGAPVIFFPLVVLAALAAFAGGALAVSVAIRRVAGASLLDELRGITPQPSQATMAALDGLILALAAAGLLELVQSGVGSGSGPNPLALIAPALLGLAISVIGVRALPLLGKLGVGLTAFSKEVAAGLALRNVFRRPSVLRQVMLLTVATGLMCFAVEAWAVADANRVDRADFELGAPRVLQVQTPASVNLVTAVREADPAGRYAMAVETSRSPSQNLIAVDATRLSRVAYWPFGLSKTRLAQIVRWLQGNQAPPLVLTGTAVRMKITLAGTPDPPPDLQFNLLDSDNNAGVADFGYLETGTHIYSSALPATCVGGCRVESLTPYWSAAPGGPEQASYSITVSGLKVRQSHRWLAPGSWVYRPGYWQPSASGTTISGSASEISFSFHDTESDLLSPSVSPAPLPAILPGLVTRASVPSDPDAASVADFDGTPLTVNARIEVSALPGLGEYGYLIDLPTALRAETSPQPQMTEYVWLARGTPVRVVKALTRAGVVIQREQTPAPTIALLNRQGVALGYEFFLFTAASAAVLVISGTIVSTLFDARRRSFELAALRMVGVRRRSLVRSLVGEQVLVLLPGLALGVAAGLLGSALALRSIPEFGSLAGGPPLRLAVQILPLAVLVAGLAMALLVGTWVAAARVMRMSSYSYLRMNVR